jgi:hydrogenase nickel incorporation protein HypA/HybF
MHEAAITRGMLDVALRAAAGQGAKQIRKISLLVGAQSGVVPACVQQYFDWLKVGTPAEGAVLEFQTTQLRIRCPKCGAEFSDIEQMCGCNAGGEVVSGQELLVESIEVD